MIEHGRPAPPPMSSHFSNCVVGRGRCVQGARQVPQVAARPEQAGDSQIITVTITDEDSARR